MTHRVFVSLCRSCLIVTLLICSSCATNKNYPTDSMVLEGVMEKANIEGGCWIFKAKGGKPYELVGNEVQRLRREGQRAEMVVKPRDDLASICMVGRIVEVVEILKIY